MSDLHALARRLEQFANARDWAQFHTPKNLAMALAGEVGELVAEFQWLTPEQAVTVMTGDAEAAARIRAELGDVANYPRPAGRRPGRRPGRGCPRQD
jgi:NTP pyrophosphatase (non-canonical NTP hydrolase)